MTSDAMNRDPLHVDGTSEPAGRLWIARVLTAVSVLFLVFDGVTKIMNVNAVKTAMVELGYPDGVARGLGVLILLCLAVYLVPRTAVLGAILLTGFLGGAVASQVRISHPLFGYTLFPVYIALMLWGGLYLRDSRLRALIPLRSKQ